MSWIPIIISALGLLAGTGWLQFFLNKKKERINSYKLLLTNILKPLESTTRNSLKFFNDLCNDPTFTNLEGRPSDLKRYFDSLDDKDPRKLWRLYIERMRSENQRGLQLIELFLAETAANSKIVLDDFLKACQLYKDHVEKWEMQWKAVEGIGIVSEDPLQSFAPQFPVNFDSELQKEIKLISSKLN